MTQESSGPTDYSKQVALSDICEKTEENITSDTDARNRSTDTYGTENVGNVQEEKGSLYSVTPDKSGLLPKSTPNTDDPAPNTAYGAEIGTDLPSGRASEASSVPTYSNKVVSKNGTGAMLVHVGVELVVGPSW